MRKDWLNFLKFSRPKPKPELFQDFLFAEVDGGQATEVLRVGTFVDMNGNVATFTVDDLDKIAENFAAGQAGQEIPVDIDHEYGESAGWLLKVWRDGEKLLAKVDWNKVGVELVGEKVYRYISASIDLGRMVLRAISLTNFPAVKGLAPVELSEGVLALANGEPGTVTIAQYLQAGIHRWFTMTADEMAMQGWFSTEERINLSAAIGDALEAFMARVGPEGDRIIRTYNDYAPYPDPDEYVIYGQRFPRKTEARLKLKSVSKPKNAEEDGMGVENTNLEELRAQIRQELETEQKQRTTELADLRQQVREELEAELKAQQVRRTELMAFAEQLGKAGLATPPAELVDFLIKLDEDELPKAKAILEAKVVDFSERGSAREGAEDKPKLPEVARQDVLKGELTVKQLFQAKVLTGKPEDYDLSEFSQAQLG